jgi:hypothetical protein
MEALFFGICTHLQHSVRDEPHRVALPASDNYSVMDPITGALLEIPNHTAQLAIREADVLEGDITVFADQGLHRIIPPPVVGELCWTLDQVIFNFDDLEADLSADLHCLPHIGFVELQTSITDGSDLIGAAAFIDVRNGALSVVRDKGTLEGRHVLLAVERQVNPWLLQVRTLGGQPRTLRMMPDAHVTFSNRSISPEAPCDQNDYLLNFRLTKPHFVTASDFRLPSDCSTPASPIDMRAFPSLSLVGDSGTLSDCSNTVYP